MAKDRSLVIAIIGILFLSLITGIVSQGNNARGEAVRKWESYREAVQCKELQWAYEECSIPDSGLGDEGGGGVYSASMTGMKACNDFYTYASNLGCSWTW